MIHGILKKLTVRRGVNRLVLLLLLAVLAAAGLSLIPVMRASMGKAEYFACELELEKVNKMMPVGSEVTMKAAQAALQESGASCPSGGDYYIVHGANSADMKVVCGIHEPDTSLRTRLNADAAYGQAEELVRMGILLQQENDTAELTLNGATLVAHMVEDLPDIRRGTDSTYEYDGTVVFYRLSEEKINWFCYADENHCAVWEKTRGWSMDGVLQ